MRAGDRDLTGEQAVRVAALYRFAAIADREAVRDRLEALCRPDVRGTLLVALKV